MILSRRRTRPAATAPASTVASVALAALAALAGVAALGACGEAGDGAPPAGAAGSGAIGPPVAAGAGGAAGGASAGAAGGPAPDPFASGAELRVPVAASGRAFVRLDPLGVVTPTDPAASTEWDLAFEGYDVFTNGGVSGPGEGSAFGPFDAADFAAAAAPAAPFTVADRTGGAFLDWYKYSGAPDHTLWSRFHVYGVKDGERAWKVQILTYYTPRDNFPTSALYALRYTAVGPDGAGTTQEVIVDGTGANPTPADTSTECLDLGTGERPRLTPEQARASSAWHLCFRRDSVSVNGGLGGPRGATAVDFDAAQTNAETLEGVSARTGASELPRFDDLGFDRFAAAPLKGDRVVSAFDGRWADVAARPPAPALATWLVEGADGAATHLVGFAAFDGAGPDAPGTVVLRAKRVGP